jgi:hypothetical protein
MTVSPKRLLNVLALLGFLLESFVYFGAAVKVVSSHTPSLSQQSPWLIFNRIGNWLSLTPSARLDPTNIARSISSPCLEMFLRELPHGSSKVRSN